MNLTKITNWLALALSGTGAGALAADLFGFADVPDTTAAQVVYLVAILAGLAWKALPDGDGDGTADALQGRGLDWRAWLQNLWGTVRRTGAAVLLVPVVGLASGCGGALADALPEAYDSVRACLHGGGSADVTAGDAGILLFRMKANGDACATYDLGQGLSLESEACARAYGGPFNDQILSTCAERSNAPADGSGDGSGAE